MNEKMTQEQRLDYDAGEGAGSSGRISERPRG